MPEKMKYANISIRQTRKTSNICPIYYLNYEVSFKTHFTDICAFLEYIIHI